MSSQGDRHGHLDATAGREVVFCHACSNEWYQEEHGLECPRCGSEITEIVDLDNDPRDPDHNSSASTSPEMPPLRYRDDDDSDPEEGDIEDHMGPHGFAFSRSVRDGHHHHHHHHNPDVDPVFDRFVDMIRGFSPPGRAGGPNMFPPGAGEREREHQHHHEHEHEHEHEHDHDHEHDNQPRIHRATFTSGFGNGTAQVTIVSGPIHHNFGGGFPPPTIDPDRFQTIFSNILREATAPQDGNRQPQGGEEQGGGPPRGFARSLHDILSLLNPANAVAGDAVYSQEALDRIITSLMDNPGPNAAPPATHEALQNLVRKPIDKEMLHSNGGDGSAECTICIDSMEEGQTAAVLPCKHWFHEECVVLWLKEHNTCPICRTPIETNDRNNNNGNNSNNDSNGDGSNQQGNGDGDGGAGTGGPNNWQRGPGLRMPGVFNISSPWTSGRPPGFGGPADGWDSYSNLHHRAARPPSQSQSPLNEVLRTLSSNPRERERNRERERDRAMASGYSYDTSRLQRRSSHSPTSPRNMTAEEQGARWRQRSPSASESSRRSMMDRDRDQDRDSDRERDQRRSSGPFGWLRDRFGGSSGGGGPNRDGRRP